MAQKNKKLYLTHIEEAALPAPKNLPLLEHHDPETTPDLFLWCVDDITLKLKKQNAEIPENYRESLYRSIFAYTLEIALEEMTDEFNHHVEKIASLQSVEEVLSYLSDVMDSDPAVGFIFNKSLIAAYVSKCMEYGISANKLVSSLLYQ